jgi:YaiO family outer membrane protein
VRFAIVLSAVVCVGVNVAGVFAQSHEWAVDYTREQAATSNHGVPATWTTDRFVTSWARPGAGGWLVEIERQRRRDIGDVALRTSAYRRAGDWTFAGDVAMAPDARFLSGAGGGGEVSYRAVGTVVASGGYHIRQYPTVTIHQFEPGVTWYRARGELQARLFVTRDTSIPRTSTAALFRGAYDAAARLRLRGGVSIGERIFDIEPLALTAGNSRLGYVEARLRLTTRNFVLASVTVAHEEPAFKYVAATFGYKRLF